MRHLHHHSEEPGGICDPSPISMDRRNPPAEARKGHTETDKGPYLTKRQFDLKIEVTSPKNVPTTSDVFKTNFRADSDIVTPKGEASDSQNDTIELNQEELFRELLRLEMKKGQNSPDPTAWANCYRGLARNHKRVCCPS